VIRQAISCDICGTEKKQTNHWFVAYDQGGELRVSGWNSRNRLRSGSKHLCGQTCLHKLVGDFMAKALLARVQPSTVDEAEVAEQALGANASLTSDAALREAESSARLVTTPTPATPARVPLRMPVELVPMPARVRIMEAAVPADDSPRYASRNCGREPGTGSGCAHCAPVSGGRFLPPCGAPVPDASCEGTMAISDSDGIRVCPHHAAPKLQKTGKIIKKSAPA
jgi:hypothetical protein